MRSLGLGKGNITHQGLLWGGGRGRMALGVIPDVDDELMGADELMDAAGNHHSQQTFIRTEN